MSRIGGAQAVPGAATVPDLVDVAVVGGGLLGVYTGWRLAESGAAVTVFDQGIAGAGSTGRSSGGLRRQFGTAYEIDLSAAGFAFYDWLERQPDFIGRIDRLGYVFLAGHEHHEMLARSYQLQRDRGVDVRWLVSDGIRSAYPYLDATGIVGGTRCDSDGFIDPAAVHRWLMGRARAAGTTVRQQSTVRSVQPEGTGWLVAGDGFMQRTEQVVLAAGAWTGSLVTDLGVRLPVTPSPRVKVLTDAHLRLPALMPLITDLTTGACVRSDHGHALVGAKPAGTPPTGFAFDLGLEHLTEILGRAAVRFPSLADAGIMRTVHGLYEVTPDGLPLAGPVDGRPGMWVIAGFNGHGIIHGPAVADALCAQMTGGAEDVDLGPLDPGRFAGGSRESRSPTLL